MVPGRKSVILSLARLPQWLPPVAKAGAKRRRFLLRPTRYLPVRRPNGQRRLGQADKAVTGIFVLVPFLLLSPLSLKSAMGHLLLPPLAEGSLRESREYSRVESCADDF